MSGMLLTALTAALLQSVAHLAVRLWFPSLGRVARYVLGVLGMCLPLGVFYLALGDVQAALALGAVVAASGMSVFGWYALGDYIETRRALRDAGEREAQLSEAVWPGG